MHAVAACLHSSVTTEILPDDHSALTAAGWLIILCKELRAGRLCDELLEWVGRQEHRIRIINPHGAILLMRKVHQLAFFLCTDTDGQGAYRGVSCALMWC